jgi:Domain of unknown function (DUF4349)
MRKRNLILISGCLMLAACSQNEDISKSKESLSTMDVAEEASTEMAASPNVSPSAAPGVAFNYRYAFRVPDAKIAGVQEEHAAACETLGLSRCRITGMRYTLEDEDEVRASLAFKLDPIIARKFGKDAIASVAKAEGILVDSQIQGVDAGSEITASQRRSADVSANLDRTEKRLAAGGIKDRERTELQEQAARMREQLSAETDTRRAGEASLATTPMEFSYSGGEGIPGFGRGNPFADAWDSAVASFATMASFLMLAIGVLLPWLMLGVLLVALWRTPPLRKLRGWLRVRRDAVQTEVNKQ